MINDETLQAGDKSRTLAMTCAAFGTVLLCYLGAVSLALPGWSPAKAAGLFAVSLFYGYAFIAWRTSQYRWVAHALIFTAQIMAFAASLTNGGLNGYVAPLQVVAPLAAGFFLTSRSAVIYGAISVGFFALLLVFDINGWVSPTPYSAEAERIAALLLLSTTTLLGLICVIGFVRALERMLGAARQADQAKSVFLANMSHEIRTPMNGVLGLLDLARNGPDGRLDAEGVKAAHASATALITVLNDVLDVSKLDQGGIEIRPEPCDLKALCDEVIGLFAVQTGDRDIGLVLDYEDSLPRWYVLDAVRLRQVLWNLVGNAVKFTARGHVRLVVRQDPDHADSLRVEVEDTGIGLSADACDRIFDRFAQADDTTTRDFGGTGLGLTICRELTRLMGGDLAVESEMGQGSTFHFRLIATPVELAAGTAPSTDEPVGDGTGQGKTGDSEVRSLTVLVVDDQAINRTAASALLQHLGHDCVLAHGGEDALARAAVQRFDAILMDIQMPGMDGMAVTRRIRRDIPLNAATPIHALTANAFAEDRALYQAAGMDGCLGKPLQIDTLAAQLATQLATPVAAPPTAAQG